MKTDIQENLFIGGCFLVFLLILVAVGIGVCKVATSSGEADYCYVEILSPGGNIPPHYRLMAHRPWRQDRHVAVYPSFDDAVKAANSMQCPVK